MSGRWMSYNAGDQHDVRKNLNSSMPQTKLACPVILHPVAAALLIFCGQSDAFSQEDSTPSYVKTGGDAGVGSYRAGRWGMVSVRLANPTNSPVTVKSVLSFDRQSNMQFGREIWIPPKSRRSTWYSIRAPDDAPLESRIWEIDSILFDTTENNETPIPARTGELVYENLIPVGRENLTGLIVDPDNSRMLSHLVWAARLSCRYPKKFSEFLFDQLPRTAAHLDGLDHLLIASDHVQSDPAACMAIREWLHRGGHLWVMLDLVDPTLISRLIGDAFQVTTVDRTERVQLQFHSHDGREKFPSGKPVSYYHPVAMERALFSGFRVSHTVDDWPAAAWTKVGRGRLLVTTVGARAWIRPRNRLDPPAPSPMDVSEFAAREALKDVAYELMVDRDPPPLDTTGFEEVLSEQIGYRIVSRGGVAALLGTFCLVLCTIGCFLWKRGRLEHLGWIGPSSMLVTSVLLLGIGQTSRETVQKTVAVTQFAETSPHTDEVLVTGMYALYSPDKLSGGMSAHSGGSFWPKLINETAGTVVRLISTDRDEWEIRNLVLPAGQQFVPFSYSQHLDQPVTAIGTFGPDGFAGVVSAEPFQEAGDAVLALPSTRNVAVHLGDGGRFSSGSQDVLDTGQFLTAGVLSDEQGRRQDVYRQLFDAADDRSPYPSRPTLLFWSRPLDPGFQLLEGADRTGSALVSVPLRYTRPEAGTRVVIPGPFITYQSAGTQSAATYDVRKRRWSDPVSEGMDTALRFQLPAELLPVRLENATLTIDIKAPSRQLEITSVRDDGTQAVLKTSQSPYGLLSFEIDGEDLQPNQAGELVLGINVGETGNEDSNLQIDTSEAQFWEIDDLQLEVAGVVE